MCIYVYIQEKHNIKGSVLFVVSGIHWGYLNAPPAEGGVGYCNKSVKES